MTSSNLALSRSPTLQKPAYESDRFFLTVHPLNELCTN